VKKFEGDFTVGSKVMAFLTRYSSLGDKTSSSPNWDSISTPRKIASGYGHFDPFLKSSWPDLHIAE
jgi:hypothetical protein